MTRVITWYRKSAADKNMKTLVVGMGNELFSDDGVGILAVRKMSKQKQLKADFVETGLHGIALLDLFIGYKKAIIVDAVKTGQVPPGTVLEINPESLAAIPNPSPHFTGVPELIKIARELKLDFPNEFKIFAVEVINTSEMGGKLSEPVARALDELTSCVVNNIN